MSKQSFSRFISVLLIFILLSSCSANPYPNDQYRMDESMLLMFTARMNLLGDNISLAGINNGTAKLMIAALQTQQEKINQMRLLAEYYQYYAQKYGERDVEVRNALTIKAAELYEQADKLERRQQRGGFFRRAGRALGRVVCFVMDRVGEKVEVVVEENIRETINAVVISPRRLAQQQITLGWHRLLGPLGGSAASIIRSELFPQLDRARERLMAETNRIPDPGNELADSILNSGSPRSDRLPSQSVPQEEPAYAVAFDTLSESPDLVQISLSGSIPCQILPGEFAKMQFKDCHWYFDPQEIRKWHLAFESNDDELKILGNFSGIALAYKEIDQLNIFDDSYADIMGSFQSSEVTELADKDSYKIIAPFQMTFSGSIHQPCTYVSGSDTPGGPAVLKYVAYQDIEFTTTVDGTLTIEPNGDKNKINFVAKNCENNEFTASTADTQLTFCYVQITWNP